MDAAGHIKGCTYKEGRIMSLFTEWTDMVMEYVKTKGEAAFWKEYSSVEERIYREVLLKRDGNFTFKVNEFAEEIKTTPEFILGFLDGINESLNKELDLESIKEDSVVALDIDHEKLYFNMLDAKADYLYTLPQWDGIFSEEKRKEIKTAYQKSKTIRNEVKIGRNDPCPCGSGKKYKKCHGSNKKSEE